MFTSIGESGISRTKPAKGKQLDAHSANSQKYVAHLKKEQADFAADAGVTFENSFSPYPLCCPARSSFLTGLYTHNHEVWSHAEPWGFKVLKDADTLPVWLQQAGYDTAFLGKYLNGYGSQPAPDGS